jgi:hypothetical protein
MSIRKFVFLAALTTGCNSNSATSSSPSETCDDVSTTLCDRLYTCLSASDLALAGLPATESACVALAEQTKQCASLTAANACPAGTSYDEQTAVRCGDQVAALDCATVRAPGFKVELAAPACAAYCR